MPGMDGFELSRLVRDEERDKGLPPCPIIAITANVQPREAARCLAVGMDDVLVKPVARAALGALLAEHAEFRVPAQITTSTIPSVAAASTA